jgi:hypothetical protein
VWDRCFWTGPEYLSPAMLIDSARWPNTVTIGKLIDRAMQLEAHCHKCGRCAVINPARLQLPLDVPLPALEGRFSM